jgi:hypothetical protein
VSAKAAPGGNTPPLEQKQQNTLKLQLWNILNIYRMKKKKLISLAKIIKLIQSIIYSTQYEMCIQTME